MLQKSSYYHQGYLSLVGLDNDIKVELYCLENMDKSNGRRLAMHIVTVRQFSVYKIAFILKELSLHLNSTCRLTLMFPIMIFF